VPNGSDIIKWKPVTLKKVCGKIGRKEKVKCQKTEESKETMKKIK
jgi:hypothetical protein